MAHRVADAQPGERVPLAEGAQHQPAGMPLEQGDARGRGEVAVGLVDGDHPGSGVEELLERLRRGPHPGGSVGVDDEAEPPVGGPQRGGEAEVAVEGDLHLLDAEETGEDGEERVGRHRPHRAVAGVAVGAEEAVDDLVGAVGEEDAVGCDLVVAGERGAQRLAVRVGIEVEQGRRGGDRLGHRARRSERRLVGVELQPAVPVGGLLTRGVAEARAERGAAQRRH